jgi:hypothetical protein
MDRQDRNAARKRISTIRSSGTVNVWNHCKDELAADGLDTVDLDNVLRCGTIDEEPELHDTGAWRYRVKTFRMCVVVQFDAEDELSVVTAWRMKGR